MHVLIAAGEMKGSLSATQAAGAIERGVRATRPDTTIESLALSDGGAGLVDLMIQTQGARRMTTHVTGPLGEQIDADWALIPGEGHAPARASIEMSAAAGLTLVAEGQRDPERTTTYGVGQLIRAALDQGCRDLTIGIGNSATCDAGAGMAAALGYHFSDGECDSIEMPCGRDLGGIFFVHTHSVDERLHEAKITVLCDVDNPLFGANGSARVFAEQKGATRDQIDRLDSGLNKLARIVHESGLPADPDTPGMGAAGGLAFGLVAFCNATLKPGADAVLDLVGFDQRAADADLVISCEGRFDATSLSGKLPVRVAERAAARSTPAVILAGSAEPRSVEELVGVATVRAITPGGMPLNEAVMRAPALLADAARDEVLAHPHL